MSRFQKNIRKLERQRTLVWKQLAYLRQKKQAGILTAVEENVQTNMDNLEKSFYELHALISGEV